jgi:hypothetical protein
MKGYLDSSLYNCVEITSYFFVVAVEIASFVQQTQESDLTNKYLHKLLKDTKTWQVVLFGLCIKGLVLVDECDLWILSSGILL